MWLMRIQKIKNVWLSQQNVANFWNLTFVSIWRWINVLTLRKCLVAGSWSLILNNSTTNIEFNTISYNHRYLTLSKRTIIEQKKKRLIRNRMYRKLSLWVRKPPLVYFVVRWSHSGIGIFPLHLCNFDVMLFCYSSSLGQQCPILFSKLDMMSRFPHYWQLLDSIYSDL